MLCACGPEDVHVCYPEPVGVEPLAVRQLDEPAGPHKLLVPTADPPGKSDAGPVMSTSTGGLLTP